MSPAFQSGSNEQAFIDAPNGINGYLDSRSAKAFQASESCLGGYILQSRFEGDFSESLEGYQCIQDVSNTLLPDTFRKM